MYIYDFPSRPLLQPIFVSSHTLHTPITFHITWSSRKQTSPITLTKFLYRKACLFGIVFPSTPQCRLDNFVAESAKHFEICDLGETTLLLGIKILRDHPNHSISLSHCHHIDDVLKRYKMSDCNHWSQHSSWHRNGSSNTWWVQYIQNIPYCCWRSVTQFFAYSLVMSP